MKIRPLFPFTSRITFDENAFHRSFITLRIEIERRKIKNRYPLAVMYADWLAHPQLNRSTSAGKVLQEVNSAIQRDNAKTHADVLSALDVRRLGTEIQLSLMEMGQPTAGVDYHAQWVSIIEKYFYIVCDHPLVLDPEDERDWQLSP